MGNPTGFLDIERHERSARPVAERVLSWREFAEPLPPEAVARQAERCMDCGVPFCHSACPVNNVIPDWNELVSEQDWKTASERLHATNNFPEFTGRVCPAPCEAACTLNLDERPVTIKSIECEIADRAFREGWVTPRLAAHGTGRRVAIVGSGPAGLACAQELARMGHNPTVFEKADRIGGLLRYGIPDFKLDKALIDRRVAQMEREGVLFRTGIEIGTDVTIDRLLDDYELVVLAGGAETARDLDIPGRQLPGVHFAMDYLRQQNRRVAGDDEGKAAPHGTINARGKHVVVIGGGDTGSDCIGTAIRQGAVSVIQLEIMPAPPAREAKALTWPHWPLKLRTSSSQEEGCEREFAVATVAFAGDESVSGLRCTRLDWIGAQPQAVDGSEFELKADLVLLAMGFTAPLSGVGSGAKPTPASAAGNDPADIHRSDRDRVFLCGDMRRGQSLVVWAIREGRDCARVVSNALEGLTQNPLARR